MDTLVRFSGLVRKGLRFRQKLDQAKTQVSGRDFEWYPYDCFANLFYMQRMLNDAGLALSEMIAGQPVLDLGAGDGALSFFLESLGNRVHAWDHSGTNINRMQGMRRLAQVLGSQVSIEDVDLDGRFEIAGHYGVALFLGALYHLKNPFYALETLSKCARFCFLSTRVARWSAGQKTRLDQIPVGYLLDAEDCNADATNYWIFSPPGLMLLAKRAGWKIRASARSGAWQSDPVTPEGDERMFLLLRSAAL